MVVTAFRGRTVWLWILVSNCVHVISKLVLMFSVYVYLFVFSSG
jgi:hypothetical protein